MKLVSLWGLMPADLFWGIPFAFTLFFIPRTLAIFLLVWMMDWNVFAYALCLLGLFLDWHSIQATLAGVEVKRKAEKPHP